MRWYNFEGSSHPGKFVAADLMSFSNILRNYAENVSFQMNFGTMLSLKFVHQVVL